MHLQSLHIYLLPLLIIITTIHASTRIPAPKTLPRDLDAILIDPPSTPPISPAPPHLKHLDLRQVAAPAAAQPAAGQNAAAPAAQPAAGQNAAAPAAQPAANQNAAPAAAPVAPAAAPAAPAAGVGGAGAAPAAAQPGANAQANPVTTVQVVTVVGGVTKTIEQLYTQSFAGAATSVPVKSGSIGMGTLTGKVGVVKTQDAKSEGVAVGARAVEWRKLGVLGWLGMMGLMGVGMGIARL